MTNNIIYEIENIKAFQELINNNTGVIIIKFGAEWCGPCKKIEGLLHELMEKTHPNVQNVVVDVDESFEVYAFLKQKKMMNGIPAILVYYKENKNYIPDDVVVGADVHQVIEIFNRANLKASKYE